MKCPKCGYEFTGQVPWIKRLHWRYPTAFAAQPLCMVSKQKLFLFADKEEDVTCKNCLKELAFRKSRGLPT